MTIEEQAAECRRRLDETLWAAHESTMDPQSAADSLLCDMNRVLRAAKDTQLGAENLKSIGALYESIDPLQPGMVAHGDDLPLLHFARSFAVIFERAVLMNTLSTVTGMAMEEQAAECRKRLDETLWAVHESTMDPQSAADSLLRDMNRVLRVAKDTQLGTETLKSIGALNESINRLKPGMVAHCQDLPLFHFARSFAVIFERAVLMNTDTVTCCLPCAWSSERRQRRGHAMEARREDDEDKEQRICAARDEPAVTTAAPAVAAATAYAAAPATTRLVGTETWKREKLRRLQLDKDLDFSPEGIEGRIMIYNVAQSVSEKELRALLLPFGRIIMLFYQQSATGGYVHAKLESNRAADEAVARLNKLELHGQTLLMKRAEYSFKRPLLNRQPMAAPAAEAAEPVLLGHNEECRRGRLMFLNVPRSVMPGDVMALLEPFGLLLEFGCQHVHTVKTHRFMHAKLESNRAADEAVARLNGLRLHGPFPLIVERAKRWDEARPQRPPQDGLQPLQHPRPDLGWWQATVVPAAAAAAAESEDAAAAESGDAAAAAVGSEAWRRELQRKQPKKYDFSPEGIEGRIMIYNVVRDVPESELRTLLLPFGELLEFYYRHPATGDAYVHAKFESNRAADEAVAQLHGLVLHGRSIIATRAKYSLSRERWSPATAATEAAAAATPAAPAESAAKALNGSEEWRREIQLQNPHKRLDFSLEAIEGRLIIANVPRAVISGDVIALLGPFGPLLEFYCPRERPDKQIRCMLAKLESNQAADEAVARLDGLEVGGVQLAVKRAMYWSETQWVQPLQKRLQ